MADPTLAITLTDNEWTLISDGNENVTIGLRTIGVIRLHRGGAKPALDTIHYRSISSSHGGFAYGSLTAPWNKIYAMAVTGTMTIEVDRG